METILLHIRQLLTESATNLVKALIGIYTSSTLQCHRIRVTEYVSDVLASLATVLLHVICDTWDKVDKR
jgi:hypothetical protein